jgi:vacuolar fusion protein MON1
MNTIHAPSILNSPASASWIPVCLPKFNPGGFVNSYISFLRKGEEEAQQIDASSGKGGEADAETPTRTELRPGSGQAGSTVASVRSDKQNAQEVDSGIALVCISGGGEFETVRTWCDTVTKVRVRCIRRAKGVSCKCLCI